MDVKPDDFRILEKADIGYLEDLLLIDGKLQIVDAEKLYGVPNEHLSQFCVLHGFYCIPTTELIIFLKNFIAGREDKTIEIGAGCGVIGDALGIISTDSYMQASPKYRKIYLDAGQEPVHYGENVLKLNASDAINMFKPKIVIGAWITHKYNPGEAWRDGNEVGVDEGKVLRKVKNYIHIGNIQVHQKKPIVSVRHQTFKFPWLFSRSMHVNDNVIWIWGKQ